MVNFLGVKIQGKVAGLVQYWITTSLAGNVQLLINEIVVDSRIRGQGIGKSIMDYITAIALQNRCQVILLATNIRNTRAQKFYFNQGFAIGSFYLYKKLV